MTDDALPDPLVDAEVDLRDFQYMELDVRVLRDSRFAAQVSGDAFRAGVLLWCAAWHQVPAGSLPDDDIELASLAGYGRFIKEWRKVRTEALTQFVKCSNGRLYHETVSEKARAAWSGKLRHFFDRAMDRLRKANKARGEKGLPPLPALTFEAWNAERLSGGVPMEKAEAFSGIPPNPPDADPGIPAENALRGRGRDKGKGRDRGNGEGEPTTPGDVGGPLPPDASAGTDPAASAASMAPPERGARLPSDWQLPQLWGQWALDEFPQWTDAKVRREAAKFRDHWCGKTGKDATKLDWLATWRNWCRSDIAHRDDPKPNGAARGRATTEGVRAALGLPPEGAVVDLEQSHG